MRVIYLDSYFDDMFSSIKSEKNAYGVGRRDFPGNQFICYSGNWRYADSSKRIERY